MLAGTPWRRGAVSVATALVAGLAGRAPHQAPPANCGVYGTPYFGGSVPVLYSKLRPFAPSAAGAAGDPMREISALIARIASWEAPSSTSIPARELADFVVELRRLRHLKVQQVLLKRAVRLLTAHHPQRDVLSESRDLTATTLSDLAVLLYDRQMFFQHITVVKLMLRLRLPPSPAATSCYACAAVLLRGNPAAAVENLNAAPDLFLEHHRLAAGAAVLDLLRRASQFCGVREFVSGSRAHLLRRRPYHAIFASVPWEMRWATTTAKKLGHRLDLDAVEAEASEKFRTVIGNLARYVLEDSEMPPAIARAGSGSLDDWDGPFGPSSRIRDHLRKLADAGSDHGEDPLVWPQAATGELSEAELQKLVGRSERVLARLALSDRLNDMLTVLERTNELRLPVTQDMYAALMYAYSVADMHEHVLGVHRVMNASYTDRVSDLYSLSLRAATLSGKTSMSSWLYVELSRNLALIPLDMTVLAMKSLVGLDEPLRAMRIYDRLHTARISGGPIALHIYLIAILRRKQIEELGAAAGGIVGEADTNSLGAVIDNLTITLLKLSQEDLALVTPARQVLPATVDLLANYLVSQSKFIHVTHLRKLSYKLSVDFRSLMLPMLNRVLEGKALVRNQGPTPEPFSPKKGE